MSVLNLVALLILLQGCNSGVEGKRGKESSPVQFPQVSVPSYINDKEQAIRYLVENYWDKFFALDASCTNVPSAVLGVDSVSFERAFGTYATLLGMADAKSVAVSTSGLFAFLDSLALQGKRKPLLTVMELCERYFYDPNSPVLNEEIYLHSLRGILGAASLTPLDKMQYEYQYGICSMNRVGTPAADFQFRQMIAPEQYKDKSLYKDVKGEYTLIFFNNPGCSSCAEILETLKNPLFERLVNEGRLSVLAMYIDEDLQAWKENRHKYPSAWIYAHDHNMILRNNTIYGLRAIPSLYLLDKEKRVILKDAPANQVISWFNNSGII